METENDGFIPMRSFLQSLRTISGIENIFGQDSMSMLDERSKSTIDKILEFVKENKDSIDDLGDFLEAILPKNAEMTRLTPGRQNPSALTVDSGYITSENRLSGYLRNSTSSLQSSKSCYVRQTDLSNVRVRTSSLPSDSKLSAGSLSSVFGSEKELVISDKYEAHDVDKERDISKTAQSEEDRSVRRIKGEFDRECGSNGQSDINKCSFTLGTPGQSAADLQSVSEALEYGLETNNTEPAEQGEEKNNDPEEKMNIPVKEKKILNAPRRCLSREEFLRSVSMETNNGTTNNFTTKRMLEAREDSTSSESDNLRSVSSDGSICSYCGRRRGTRTSVDSSFY